MKSIIALVVSIAAGLSLAATPQVKNVKAFQQYPWGKVCISYEVEGNISSSAGNGAAPFLVITAKDKSSGKVYGDVSVDSSYLSGDMGAAAGLHKVIWDVAAQGLTINSANVVFTVTYYDGSLYMIVDLSSGANAAHYPVSYLGSIPSDGWTDTYKTTKVVLRRIPAGTFKMQNTSNVTLTKPFYVGVFEVTQKQYQLVAGSNPSHFSGDTLPVEQVTYNMIRGSSDGANWPSSSAVDSTSFIGKIRARTGLKFDLPTEAQWEYACRAGMTTLYYWGDSEDYMYMWCHENSAMSHKVGTREPNTWGLYDMSGNVWEWCLDRSGVLAYGIDPKGSSSGSNRVNRGGSWNSYSEWCTSSFRWNISPSDVDSSYGFRIVCSLPE